MGYWTQEVCRHGSGRSVHRLPSPRTVSPLPETAGLAGQCSHHPQHRQDPSFWRDQGLAVVVAGDAVEAEVQAVQEIFP